MNNTKTIENKVEQNKMKLNVKGRHLIEYESKQTTVRAVLTGYPVNKSFEFR